MPRSDPKTNLGWPSELFGKEPNGGSDRGRRAGGTAVHGRIVS
jgi:hypothetical protein